MRIEVVPKSYPNDEQTRIGIEVTINGDSTPYVSHFLAMEDDTPAFHIMTIVGRRHIYLIVRPDGSATLSYGTADGAEYEDGVGVVPSLNPPTEIEIEMPTFTGCCDVCARHGNDGADLRFVSGVYEFRAGITICTACIAGIVAAVTLP